MIINYIYWAFLRVKKVSVTFLVHKHGIIMFLLCTRNMFLAQIVFSFRSPCLKTVVTDFVLPGTRGEEEREDGGLLVAG